ncbi:hypothetical protein BpHYR1_010463 [Brachionus plicatilis]|uniref:Uncharacterized protein n=1 Tax=Brachionus plicatilis TaxID=10195 RepID=A0A3M7SLW1_BRAPC|nr:hypothetical protein BpHYR1_010463 [Brachionus plicatilis]
MLCLPIFLSLKKEFILYREKICLKRHLFEDGRQKPIPFRSCRYLASSRSWATFRNTENDVLLHQKPMNFGKITKKCGKTLETKNAELENKNKQLDAQLKNSQNRPTPDWSKVFD